MLSKQNHLFYYLIRRTFAFIIITILIVTIPLITLLSQYSSEESNTYNKEADKIINQQIDSFFQTLQNAEAIFCTDSNFVVPLTLYLTPSVSPEVNADFISNSTKELTDLLIFQNNITYCLFDQAGSLNISSSNELVKYNYIPSRQSWYKEVTSDPHQSHIFFNSDRSYYYNVTGRGISIIQSINSITNGEPLGFFIIDITYPDFSNIINSKINTTLPIEIRDPKGQLLYTNLSDLKMDQTHGKIGYTNTSSQTGVTVTSYVSNQLFIAQISKIILIILLIILIYLFIIFFISVLSTRSFTNPIYGLIQKMALVRSGDFSITADYNGNIIEINDLYKSFNTLVKETDELIKINYKTNLLKSRIELNALQEKINPHFLYNALETISSQAIIDGSKTASVMCQKLGLLFYYNLQEPDMVTLGQEIKQIKDYLYLALLFSNYKNINIIYDNDGESLTKLIPKFTLQPIVENCFKHGFETKKDRENEIILRSRQKDKVCVIEISDNGSGMNEEQLSHLEKILEDSNELPKETEKRRIGLIHIKTRLKLYYGDRADLNIVSTPGKGTTVIIEIKEEKSIET